MCRPRPGYAPCEDVYGVQSRNVTCVTKCGDAPSADYICAKFVPRPPTEQICKLSCPEDCIMTEFRCVETLSGLCVFVSVGRCTFFVKSAIDQRAIEHVFSPVLVRSAWTGCDGCSAVNQTRARTILALPSGGGKNCSGISETRPCRHSSKCKNNKHKNFRYKIGEKYRFAKN